VDDPVLPLGNHVSPRGAGYLKIEKLIGHTCFPRFHRSIVVAAKRSRVRCYSFKPAGKLLYFITEPMQLSASPFERLGSVMHSVILDAGIAPMKPTDSGG
jgi:hypothetical protein